MPFSWDQVVTAVEYQVADLVTYSPEVNTLLQDIAPEISAYLIERQRAQESKDPVPHDVEKIDQLISQLHELSDTNPMAEKAADFQILLRDLIIQSIINEKLDFKLLESNTGETSQLRRLKLRNQPNNEYNPEAWLELSMAEAGFIQPCWSNLPFTNKKQMYLYENGGISVFADGEYSETVLPSPTDPTRTPNDVPAEETPHGFDEQSLMKISTTIHSGYGLFPQIFRKDR